MIKLLYATTIDVPSTRANRLQVTSMAEALNWLLPGNFLLGLRAKNAGFQTDLPCTIMGNTRSFIFAWRYLSLAKEKGCTHIYCREEKLLFFMVLFDRLFFRTRVKFCYELHHLVHARFWWHRYLLRRVARVISITHAMKKLLNEAGYTKEILVAPDAVDIGLFDIPLGKDDARRQLKLPMEKRIVMYTGTIDEPWKGVGVFYEAAKRLGDDYLFVIVGGKPHYVEEFNSLHPPIPNLFLLGHQPHGKIPAYLKAADVLVLPNSGKEEISRVSTSPMKLFEYMASGRPIIASDLPSLREILNDTNALLVSPDDADALAEGIRMIAQNLARAEFLAKQARKDVERYTWDRRAQEVLAFIQPT